MITSLTAPYQVLTGSAFNVVAKYTEKAWPRLWLINPLDGTNGQEFKGAFTIDTGTFEVKDLPAGVHTFKLQQYFTEQKKFIQTVSVTVADAPTPQRSIMFGACEMMKKPEMVRRPWRMRAKLVFTRDWNDTGGFKQYKPRDWSRVREFAMQGYIIVLCCAQSGLNMADINDAMVESWFTELMADLKKWLGPLITNIRIEMGNEANLKTTDSKRKVGDGVYWTCGSDDEVERVRLFIQHVQLPAYRAIKQVMPEMQCWSMSVTYNTKCIEQNKQAYLDSCDVITFHPYANSVDENSMDGLGRIGYLVDLVHSWGRRLALTEAQQNCGKVLKTITDPAKRASWMVEWQRQVTTLIRYCIKKSVDVFIYFPAQYCYHSDGKLTTNSPGALFDETTGAPTPFYNAMVDGVS